MRTMFKYVIPLSTGLAHIEAQVPGAFSPVRLVDKDPQTGDPAVWIEVGTDYEVKARTFEVYGTGHLIPLDAVHCGSFIDGDLVWHVYERRAK